MTPEEMNLDMLVAELEYENRLLRARNERLVSENECMANELKRLRATPSKHWSDCAVHRAPAYPPGECDCGGFNQP